MFFITISNLNFNKVKKIIIKLNYKNNILAFNLKIIKYIVKKFIYYQKTNHISLRNIYNIHKFKKRNFLFFILNKTRDKNK